MPKCFFPFHPSFLDQDLHVFGSTGSGLDPAATMLTRSNAFAPTMCVTESFFVTGFPIFYSNT
jgi:hypothetical protein